MTKPLLNDITIEITNHCQLHCQHCGIWAEEDRHEMSSTMVVRMLQEILKQYRISFVSITGGEPFLNRHCGRILRSLSVLREKKDIAGFGVYSNAAYGEGVRRVLGAQEGFLRGMHMGISIDGSEATHDRLRGQGAYGKTIQTIAWVREKYPDIVLEIKFTINSVNYAQLKDVYQLARKFKARFSPKIMEDGVDDYYHRHPMPETGSLVTLTSAMVAVVKDQIEAMFADNYSGVDKKMVEATLVLLTGGKKCILACATPAKTFFVNSRREIFPCLYMPSAGKVGEDGRLPLELEEVRKKHTQDAALGNCPKCFAYHGFLKDFNLPYLKR